MASLQNLSTFTSPGKIQQSYEKDGRLCTVSQHEITGNSYVNEYYPEINLNCDTFNTTSAAKPIDSCWRTVLVPVNEGVVKRITRTYFESGFADALDEARNSQTAASSPLVCSLAEYIFRALEVVGKLKSRLYPSLIDNGDVAISRFSETRDWTQSFVRYIVWHPNCFKIAVAGCDDVIRIYTDESSAIPALKSGDQKWISCMAWRPYSGAELAVGCQNGICLWTMEGNLHISHQAAQCSLLKHPKRLPVNAVEWNPDGKLLATSSLGDPDVLIWDVDRLANTPLKRVGLPCSLLKWSPDGSSLFSSTIGSVFRVWSADRKWEVDRWTIASGHIQSAAWSPCSSFLVFVTSEESILYKLPFVEEQLFATSTVSKQALPIADLSKITIGNKEVGGLPQSLAWDPNGHYLAVSFKNSPSIAIFQTSFSKYNLSISPSCFLTGTNTEHPSFICFQSKTRKNNDSVLTIGWSSGRIQFFPFSSM